MDKNRRGRGIFSTKNIALMAVLSAVGVLLRLLIHVHILPDPLMEIEFSDLPVMIAAAYIHPLAGLFVSLLKSIMLLPFTETGFIGELLGFFQGVALSTPFWFFRRRQKKTDFLLKVICGILTAAAVGLIGGYLLILPIMGMSDNRWILTFTFVLPYYLVRGLLVGGATYLLMAILHKTLSILLSGHAPSEDALHRAVMHAQRERKQQDSVDASLQPAIDSGEKAAQTTAKKGLDDSGSTSSKRRK